MPTIRIYPASISKIQVFEKCPQSSASPLFANTAKTNQNENKTQEEDDEVSHFLNI